jgi:hypothetical protein
MYDVGKVLYVGGGRTTNTAETIDLNSGAPAWQWTGSMAIVLSGPLLLIAAVLAGITAWGRKRQRDSASRVR